LAVSTKGLNEQQREAVRCLDGPVAVIAGAGTGKTRTIVYRTAMLLDRGAAPENVLAITFTNKAAREMRERISAMVGEDACAGMTICTIHSLCSRILREDIGELGREPGFTIFDATDQAGLVRRAMTDNGFDPKKNDPRSYLHRISIVKGIYPPVAPEDFADPVFAKIFEAYNSLLEKNNGLDFDDLLVFAARVLDKKKPAEKYRDRFRHIMVDEFQDINGIQYRIVKRLSGKSGNLYIVGDEDQSIYGWRGAVIENILEFENDFEGARTVKLERNYRSTPTILEAAGAVIENNENRRPKKLWTRGEPGDPIGVYPAADEVEEAALAIDMMIAEKEMRKLRFGDFAILYRTNAQSRPFEERLTAMGIQYTMVGGTRFFERKEVKDMTAYLRVLYNPQDDVSLLRIINLPSRGIGAASIEKLQDAALDKRAPLFSVLEDAAEGDEISKKARSGLKDFLLLLERAGGLAAKRRLSEMARLLVENLGMKEYLERTCGDMNEARRRFENVQEWVNAVAEYETGTPGATLEGFLENVSLMTEEKEDEIELQENSAILMTMHSAKGLEFRVVIIAGAEEGFIPHEKSLQEGTVDEERRLFYVAMTRARRRLIITHAAERRRFGDTRLRTPSRFIEEIPPHLVSDETPEEIQALREEAARRTAEASMDRIRRIMDRD